MNPSESLQTSVKLGRPTGRRTTRSRVLDQLKMKVCDEVAAEIRRRRLTDAAIDRLLGRRTDSRLLPAIRSGDWQAVGPDIRFVGDLSASKARELALGNGGLSKADAAGLAILHFRLPKGLSEDEIDARILHEAARVWLKREAILSAARMPRVTRKRRAPSAATAKSVSFLGG